MSTTDRTPRTPRTSRTAPRRSASTTAVLDRDGAGADDPRDAAAQARGDGQDHVRRHRRRAGESGSASRARSASRTRAPGSPGSRAPGAPGSPGPRAPRHRMLLVCTAILAAGLLGVLMLKTIISQGAFRQHELEIDLILLAEKEEALARAVQRAESPVEVERRARGLGMVPAAAPVFLRLADGKLLGEPVPAPRPTAGVDFEGAPGLRPARAPSASGAAQPSPSPAGPAGEPVTGASPSPAPSATPTATETPAVPAQPAPQPQPTPTPTSEGANQ